ncbi:MAG: hypothetical protein ACOCXR_03000 [Phototrophicaceae bacterium]
MASKNKKRESGLGQFLLAGYVGLCVVMVILALVVAFSQLNNTTAEQQAVPIEAAGTPTISPIVLTLEAQEAAPDNAAP